MNDMKHAVRPVMPSLVLAMLALPIAVAPRALAQEVEDDDTAVAREHFHEGLALADRGDWPLAALEFERALALRESPVVRFNLAQSLEHLGRLVDALNQLDHLEDGGPASRAVADGAEALREAITPRIGRIVVVVRGASEGIEVRVGGRPIAREDWSVPIAADPGTASVTLVRGEEILDTTEVTVPEGGVAHVTLGVVAIASPTDAARVATRPATMELPDGPGEEDVTHTWWLWTIVGVVAAGTVAGVVAGVLVSQPESPTAGNFMPGVVEIGP